MAGLVAGVIVSAAADGVIESAMIVSAGLILGLIAGWRITSEPAPQIVTLADSLTDSIQSEDPGTKR